VERLAVGDPILMVELRTDAPHALAFDLAQVGIHALFFKSMDEVFGALWSHRLSSPPFSMRRYDWSWGNVEFRPA
jgi:hypothetical protein